MCTLSFVLSLVDSVCFFPVLSELIDNMAEKLQTSLGVEEFSSLCIPTQVSLLYLKYAASVVYKLTIIFRIKYKYSITERPSAKKDFKQ